MRELTPAFLDGELKILYRRYGGGAAVKWACEGRPVRNEVPIAVADF